MFASVLAQSRLAVKLDQDTIFVHPPVKTDDAPLDAEDPLVRGVVVLSLPRRRQVRSIHVELEGICDAQGSLLLLVPLKAVANLFPSGGATSTYETSSTLMRRLRLDLGQEEFLEPGDHKFVQNDEGGSRLALTLAL